MKGETLTTAWKTSLNRFDAVAGTFSRMEITVRSVGARYPREKRRLATMGKKRRRGTCVNSGRDGVTERRGRGDVRQGSNTGVDKLTVTGLRKNGTFLRGIRSDSDDFDAEDH